MSNFFLTFFGLSFYFLFYIFMKQTTLESLILEAEYLQDTEQQVLLQFIQDFPEKQTEIRDILEYEAQQKATVENNIFQIVQKMGTDLQQLDEQAQYEVFQKLHQQLAKIKEQEAKDREEENNFIF